MPLFFLASGLTTDWSRDSLWRFILLKANSIIRPFLGYSLILGILLIVFDIEHPHSSLRSGWGGYALWFVPVLFVSLLLAKVFFLAPKKLGYLFLMPALSYLFCYFDIDIPWNMSVCPYAAMFIVLGSYCKTYIDRIETSHRLLLPLFGLIPLIVSNFWRLDMCYNAVIPIVPLTIGAVSGTIFIFLVSVEIEKHVSFASKILQNIGKETFLILAFSQIYVQIINQFFNISVILKYIILIVLIFASIIIKDKVSRIYYYLLSHK